MSVNTTITESKGYNGPLGGIQCLRALAALMVVWVHAREQAPWLRDQFQSTMGAHGVDLFFVVSGFIMVVSTHGKKPDLKRFLTRRFVRIVPLYWLATATLLGIALVAPTVMKSTVVSWPHVAGSFLFFPVESPALPGKLMPLVIPGWTLNYEMFFYLIFGVCTFFFTGIRSIIIIVILAALSLFGWFLKPDGVIGFYCDLIIFTFGMGIAIGEAFCRGKIKHSAMTSAVLAMLGALLFLSLHGADVGHRIISAGIPAAIIVLGVLASPPQMKWPKWLVKIGDSSYSLYLSHIFVLGAMRAALGPLLHGRSEPWLGWAFMVTALVISAGVAYGVYCLIEKPLTSRLQRALER